MLDVSTTVADEGGLTELEKLHLEHRHACTGEKKRLRDFAEAVFLAENSCEGLEEQDTPRSLTLGMLIDAQRRLDLSLDQLTAFLIAIEDSIALKTP